jgi:hypothetical protein
VAGESFSQESGRFGRIIVGAAEGFRNDLVDHAETFEVFGIELECVRRFWGGGGGV